MGESVLVCDLDGQVALTTSVGFNSAVYEDSGESIYTLITELEGDVNAVIRAAPNDRFDVLPGNIQMYLAEKALATERNRERRLERIFEDIEKGYDYILVDCPPNLGTVTDNALLACRRILIPARMHQTYTYTITTLLAQIRHARKRLSARHRDRRCRAGGLCAQCRPKGIHARITREVSRSI